MYHPYFLFTDGVASAETQDLNGLRIKTKKRLQQHEEEIINATIAIINIILNNRR